LASVYDYRHSRIGNSTVIEAHIQDQAFGNRDIFQREASVAALRARGTPTPDYVKALIDLADITIDLDYVKAERILREACAYAELLQYRDGLIIVLIRLSWILLRLGKVNAALTEARRARYLAEEAGQLKLRCAADYVTACVYQHSNASARAISLLEMLSHDARDLGDAELEADYLCELAIAHRVTGDYARALECQHQAHAIYEQLGDRNLALSHNNLAVAHSSRGQYDDAHTHVQLARALCPPDGAELRYVIEHSAALIDLGMGRYQDAVRGFGRALDLCRAANNSVMFCCTMHLDRAMAHSALGDTSHAIEDAEAALTCALSVNATSVAQRAHHALSRLYGKVHAFELAASHAAASAAIETEAERCKMQRGTALSSAEAGLAALEQRWREQPGTALHATAQ
jgi:tetratricopeptide (TPR) repeat protein